MKGTKMKEDIRDKSLSQRLPEHIFSRIHQDIGKASMCWSETPLGNFNSNRASIIAFNLCQFIADEIENAISNEKVLHGTDTEIVK